MRAVTGVAGVLIALVGLAAVITGEFSVHGGWPVAIALGALGLTGLIATAMAVSN